jgi:hypothetical protein
VPQACDICGREGRYYHERIVTLGQVPAQAACTGQCPQCLRFYCPFHCLWVACIPSDEALPLLPDPLAVPTSALHCPLHAIPLGRTEGTYVLIMDRPADGSSAGREGDSLERVKRFLSRHAKLDLTGYRLEPHGVQPWPLSEAISSSLMEALFAAQRIFEHRLNPDQAVPLNNGKAAAPPGRAAS